MGSTTSRPLWTWFPWRGRLLLDTPEKVALWGHSGEARRLFSARRVTTACRRRQPGRPRRPGSHLSPREYRRVHPALPHGGADQERGYPASEDEFFDELMAHRPIDCVSHVAPTPLLIVQGTLDSTVPVECAHRLYEAAGNPKDLVIIERGEHKLRLNRQATDAASPGSSASSTSAG